MDRVGASEISMSNCRNTRGQFARCRVGGRGHRAADKRQVKRWMTQNMWEFEDPLTGEINMTRLAEEAAYEVGEPYWLDDSDHWIWDASLEVAGPTLR